MNARALHLIAEAREARLRRPRPLHRRPRFRAGPVGLLDAGYLDCAPRTDRSGSRHGPAQSAGTPPQIGGRRLGDDETLEAAGHQPFLHRRRQRQRAGHDHHHRSGFGSRLWAAGFLLNNELTDFAFRPVDRDGRPLANAVGPGKRPRSSMAPTIVFDEAGQAVGRAGLARRQPHHPVRGEDAGGADRLEDRRAGRRPR